MRPNVRRARGQATVELALSLLVLVPVFLYALLLDDLLSFLLDTQEAATSSTWDFAVQDYQAGVGDPDRRVGSPNRHGWCDHTSAYSSYSEGSECAATRSRSGASGNHHGIAGHGCWLVPGGEEVTCSLLDREIGGFQDSTAGGFHQQFTRGGLFECHARGGVINRLLPQGYLQRLSGGQGPELTDKRRVVGPPHRQELAAGDVFLLARQGLALVADPWAMNSGPGGGSPEVDLALAPEKQRGPWFDRVQQIYAHNPDGERAPPHAARLVAHLVQDKLIGPEVLADAQRLSQAAVSVRLGAVDRPPPPQELSEEGTRRGYDATPWRDWDTDRPKATWQRRGRYYLGHQGPAEP